MTFEAGSLSETISISITDDEIAEYFEHFSLVLEVPQESTDMGVVAKTDFTAVVNITDDDGMKLYKIYHHTVQVAKQVLLCMCAY